MNSYLRPIRGLQENATMTFVGFGLVIFAWTFGAGIFALIPSLIWGEKLDAWQVYFISFVQFIPILMAVIFATLLFKRKSLTLITNDRKFSWQKFRIGVLSWLAILTSTTTLALILNPESLKYTFDLGRFLPALLVLICLLPVQVLAEELFFRGYLPQALSRTKISDGLIILISTLVFAAPHLLNPEAQSEPFWALIAYSAMGFGWIYAARKLGSLEIAIGAHLANNFFGLTIVGYENSVVAPSSIWVGPAADMQNSAIALWVTVGIWLFIVTRISQKRHLTI